LRQSGLSSKDSEARRLRGVKLKLIGESVGCIDVDGVSAQARHSEFPCETSEIKETATEVAQKLGADEDREAESVIGKDNAEELKDEQHKDTSVDELGDDDCATETEDEIAVETACE